MYTPFLGAPYSTNIGYPGTRGPNTRGSVNGPGSIPGPTIPGTRHRVPGSQSDGVQLYNGVSVSTSNSPPARNIVMIYLDYFCNVHSQIPKYY